MQKTLQLKVLDQFSEAGATQMGWITALLHGQQQIVLHGQVAENAGLLRQIADAHAGTLRHGKRTDRFAIEEHITTIWPKHAGDKVERGGLARSIGPQQPDHFTRIKLQADPANHRAARKGQFHLIQAKRHRVASAAGLGWSLNQLRT